MVKKFNIVAGAIKAFLAKGYNQAWISRKLGISKQKVNYWSKTSMKTVQYRKTKLPKEYIDKIGRLAEDKLTSDMGSRKIACIINPLTSTGEGVTVFTSPYLSAGAPALGEAKGLI